MFSPELLRALREDSEASKKAKGEIVGLDFDPFLATQDPAERYQVGRVTRQGDSHLVGVFSVSSGEVNEKPDVVAEVARGNGGWLFVNCRYPDRPADDLLATLKRLRKERQRK